MGIAQDTIMGIARETIWLGLVCLADLILTACLISTGAFTEGNPLLAHYLHYGLGAMCAVKLFSFLTPLALAEWYRRRDPAFVRGMLRGALGVYVVAYVAGVTAVNLPLWISW